MSEIMVDVNKLLTNPRLVAAMEQMTLEPSAENEQVLWNCVQTAKYLMLYEGEPLPDGADIAKPSMLSTNNTLRFPMLMDTEGRPWHVAFTDWLAIQAWGEQSGLHALVVSYSDWPALLANSDCAGFVVNPTGYHLQVSRARVLGQNGAYTVPEGTKVLLGEPQEYPQALVEALTKLLKTMQEVRSAWLMLMVNGTEQSYLTVVDFEGDRAAINNAIGRIAAPLLPPGMYLDIVSARDSLGREAIQNREPFYDKRRRFFPWRQ